MATKEYFSSRVSTKSDNPLRERLERYRHEKLSQTMWNKVSKHHYKKVEDSWMVMTEGGLFDDWLEIHPYAEKLIAEISKQIDNNEEYYYEP